MATNIGNLFVNFGVNATGFIKGTETAKKKLTEFQKHTMAVQKTLAGFKTAFGVVGLGIGINQIFGTITKTIDALDELGDTAEKLNIDPVRLGGLRFAAEQTSSSAEAMTTALETIPVKAADAVHGMKKVQKVFQELGVDARKLLELSPDQMFLKVADAIQQLPTAGEQMRFAERLFGGDAASLLPMLRQGAAGMQQFTDTYIKSVGDMSKETMAAADKAKQALGELRLTWQGMKNDLVNWLNKPSAATGGGNFMTELTQRAAEFVRGDIWLKEARKRTAAREIVAENEFAKAIAPWKPKTAEQFNNERKAREKGQQNILAKETAGSVMRWLWATDDRLLRRKKWVDEKGKTIDTKVFVNPIMETIRSHIESATGLLKAAGPAIEKAEAIGRRWQFYEFFVKPFLPQAKIPAAITDFGPDSFTAKRMDSPEAIQAENRFKQMTANIQNKQLLEQKQANQHLQRIERNVRQEAKIDVVEVGIVG